MDNPRVNLSEPTSLSVVIPAYNEEKLIGGTLRAVAEALGHFSAAGWEVETVVCDNNSTDRTGELARAAGANVVFEPINQIARARNAGAAAARGDWLVFVDADSCPSKPLFASMEQAISTGKVLAGGATVRFDRTRWYGHAMVSAWNWTSRLGGWMAGSFIFCRADAFRKIGGFSTELFAGEEIEFAVRLKRVARKERKRVVILHRHPLETSARKLHLYGARDWLGFFLRTVLGGGRSIRRREECAIWYDGRR